MEYANAGWIHEMGSRPHESALTSHDPIITDTNLNSLKRSVYKIQSLFFAGRGIWV